MESVEKVKLEDLLTEEEIETVAKRAFGESFSKLIEHQLENYSDTKLGFLGNHSRLNLTAELKNQEILKFSFFVKSMFPRTANQTEFRSDILPFEEENIFYSNVAPEIYKNCIIERWSAQCYLAKSNILVLEDLKEFSMGVRPLSGKNLTSVLCLLARFHASSILTEARLGQTLDQAFPDSFKEKLFNESSEGQKWLAGSIDIAKT